jgi:hypothetical protein
MQEVITGIVAALKAGTALMARISDIYMGVGPGTATYPFVTVNFYSGADRALISGGWHDQTYTVKCVDRNTSALPALQIQGLIDLALTAGTVISISGHTTLWLRRVTPIEYQEVDGEDIYWHCGGNYRITLI